MSGPSRIAMSEAVRRLAAAGCVAPAEEAEELAIAARGDDQTLAGLVGRRSTGEPLAWITGRAAFCGRSVLLAAGVYVPRWQSEPLAERAAALLPPDGRAIDLGTGSGAIACVLLDRRPGASVIGTELDPVAARCARQNGVTVAEGDLFEAVPASWEGWVDVVIAVLPYVPTNEIAYLPRDVRAFEPTPALDGGGDGLEVVRRAVTESRRWLRSGGHLLVEVGGDQPEAMVPILEGAQFGSVRIITDADGDPRGVEAAAPRLDRRRPPRATLS
ncbi:MAG: peptide chain release factor N(5)-glutamine methyltransferase [Acidimicrobiales bacterium]|nr:peptide chain release factor N(5)-glutamine methyltransferase [Acidimicrobiales bacterium]